MVSLQCHVKYGKLSSSLPVFCHVRFFSLVSTPPLFPTALPLPQHWLPSESSSTANLCFVVRKTCIIFRDSWIRRIFSKSRSVLISQELCFSGKCFNYSSSVFLQPQAVVAHEAMLVVAFCYPPLSLLLCGPTHSKCKWPLSEMGTVTSQLSKSEYVFLVVSFVFRLSLESATLPLKKILLLHEEAKNQGLT